MSLQRWAARRDAAEQPITQALKAVGARVWKLSGKGKPDLLVSFHGRWTPLEVKSAGGTLTEAQAGIPWPVVRTVDEALVYIGARAPERSAGAVLSRGQEHTRGTVRR